MREEREREREKVVTLIFRNYLQYRYYVLSPEKSYSTIGHEKKTNNDKLHVYVTVQ